MCVTLTIGVQRPSIHGSYANIKRPLPSEVAREWMKLPKRDQQTSEVITGVLVHPWEVHMVVPLYGWEPLASINM